MVYQAKLSTKARLTSGVFYESVTTNRSHSLVPASCILLHLDSWHVKSETSDWRSGYGWLWSGPSSPEVLPGYGQYHSPDLPIIVIRLIAVSAIAGAAWTASLVPFGQTVQPLVGGHTVILLPLRLETNGIAGA